MGLQPTWRARAFLGAPAIALILTACGSGGDEVASFNTAVVEDSATSTVEAETTTSVDDTGESTTSEESSTTGTSETTTAPALNGIELLPADQAIANAEANIDGLQLADSVLDIEVLAVGDGSVQTLRNVVTGNRPVLLWFYSPH